MPHLNTQNQLATDADWDNDDARFAFSDDAARLILEAASNLEDEVNAAIAESRAGIAFEYLSVATWLPSLYSHKYDGEFYSLCLAALQSVKSNIKPGGGLFEPRSVLEEMVLFAVFVQAEHLLTSQESAVAEEAQEETEEDLSTAQDLSFEDQDFLMLYDPSIDGFQDAKALEAMGLVNLHFSNWATPFAVAL